MIALTHFMRFLAICYAIGGLCFLLSGDYIFGPMWLIFAWSWWKPLPKRRNRLSLFLLWTQPLLYSRGFGVYVRLAPWPMLEQVEGLTIRCLFAGGVQVSFAPFKVTAGFWTDDPADRPLWLYDRHKR